MRHLPRRVRRGLALRLGGGQLTLGELPGALGGVLPNLAGALAGRARTAAPAFVTWALTERCPMRCRHCDMGTPTAETDRLGRLAIAHELAESRVRGVSLIGGEATLVPDLGDLAAILVSAGKHVSVGTSGLGLRPHLEAFVRMPIANLTLSADSHLRAEHDRFRGRDGLFDELLAAARRVRRQRVGRRPRVQIRATLHRGNFATARELYEFWRREADAVILQVIQDNGIHTVRDAGVRFVAADRPAFEAALAALLAAHPELDGPYLRLAARYVFAPEALRRDLRFRCLLVPAATLTILPDGRARLCYGREDSEVGDVLRDGLVAVWRSARRGATSRRMMSLAPGCMCWEHSNAPNLELNRALSALRPARRSAADGRTPAGGGTSR